MIRSPRFIVLFVALVMLCLSALAQSPPAAHPIQILLARYAGSNPSVEELAPYVRNPEAQRAVGFVLTAAKHQDSWPGAVLALGMISDLESRGVQQELVSYMNSLEIFGCVATDCRRAVESHDARLLRWDRLARLKVPIALGYLVKNTANPNLKFFTLSFLAEIAKGLAPPIPACERDESCLEESQLNAVRGLEVSGANGVPFLTRVIEFTQNALVKAEAQHAVDNLSNH